MLAIPVILLGGLVLGWVASIVLKTSYYHGVILNLIVGVLGAVVCGHFFAPVLQRPSMFSGSFSGGTVLIALGGSALLLLTVEVIRRAGTR